MLVIGDSVSACTKIISKVINDRHQFDYLHQPIAMQERQPIIAQRGGTIETMGRKPNSASLHWGKGDS